MGEVTLNRKGYNHAKKMVRQGKVQKEGEWNLTNKERKELSSEWFLGNRGDELLYPIGKEGKVWRSGVIAAKQRSAQQGHNSIFDAASDLLDMIDEKKSQAQSGEKVVEKGGGELTCYGVVGMDFSAKELLEWDGDVVRVNSPGGFFFDGLAMYNILKERNDVKVVVDGLAASAASLLACGGKVCMPENAFFMIHNPSSGAFGERRDLEKEAGLLKKLEEEAAKIYSEKSGLDVEKVKEMMNEETWLTGAEAKELGFCDEVLPKREIDNVAGGFDVVMMYKKVPKELLENIKQCKEDFVMKEMLMKKLGAIGVEVVDADGLGEHELMERLIGEYEKRLESMEVAAAVSSLKERVGEEMAMLLGKVKPRLEKEVFDAIVGKIEEMRKMLEEVGGKKIEVEDGPPVVSDDLVMKKANEIAEKEGINLSDALVELAKREPELIANWK